MAIAVLLLLQVPPATAHDNVVEKPGHKDVVPVMALGSGFTEITLEL